MTDAEKVHRWLKSTGRNRKWLAGQCRVSEGTVHNWLARNKPRPMPGHVVAFIEKLMADDQIDRGEEFTPEIPLAVALKAAELAAKEGISLEEWITRALRDAIKEG